MAAPKKRVTKKRTAKKKATSKSKSVTYRRQVQIRKENRAHYGFSTPVQEAYEVVHDNLVLLERKEKATSSPEEILKASFTTHNAVISKDGGKNFEVLAINYMFERALDELTSLLTWTQVESSNRKDALTHCCEIVSQYIPIRRIKVKEETAKTRTASKKTTSKKGTSKKTVSKKGAGPATKKKTTAKAATPAVKKTGKFVVFGGASVDSNAADEKRFGDGPANWDAFDAALKKGKVKPSTTVGYKNNEGNVFAQVINSIGGNRGKFVLASKVVAFVVENNELSEQVARKKLYKLLNDGQLDIA